ncbi:MAG: alpha-glucosidase [Nocardioides sp.]|nr:alpha-glucosidase [Nocardioides sp.]
MSGRSRPGAEWWRSAVVYHVYPRSFLDTTGSGVGDINGVRARLDYLQRLGVDVVWLSPVYPSPNADNGYDVSDHRAVDPAYGTLAELDALCAELHERGMRLVMDLVVNHTSVGHPWFQDSRAGGVHADWYWWRDEPNNWGSLFSGPAWEHDDVRRAWFLHLFSPGQADLNWENPQVRAEVHDIMRWWLDRGVDGFRMDVINMVSKDPALPDGPVPPGGRYGTVGRAAIDGPRIHEYLAEIHREVIDRYDRDVLLVAEMPGTTLEEVRRYTDPAAGEVDMVLGYDHLELDHGESKFDRRPFPLSELRDTMAAWQTGLADTGWNTLYWDNHDQPRIVSRYGNDGRYREESAKALATVLHLQRGTPFVYQGDELGMTNHPFATIDDFDDFEALNHFQESVALGASPDAVLGRLRAMSRENSRTPMQWTAGEQGGFTTGTPWLAVNPNHTSINAADQVDDPSSVFSHYRELIRLRHEEPCVVEGDFTLLAPDHPRLFAYARRHGATRLVVVANLADDKARLGDLSGECRGELVLGNDDGDVLGPWESRVYRER